MSTDTLIFKTNEYIRARARARVCVCVCVCDVLYYIFVEEEKASLYSNLASAAESGWDFSSRWFKSDAPSKLNLSSTVIKDLVPVDLNSILCMTERLLAKFYNITGTWHSSRTIC